MIIWVNVFGTLQNHFKDNRFSIELAEEATLRSFFLHSRINMGDTSQNTYGIEKTIISKVVF